MRNITEITDQNVPLGKKLIGVEITKERSSLRGVRLFFEGDQFVEIAGEYGVKVHVRAEPKMVDAYRVHGEISDGIKVSKVFKSKYDADRYFEEVGSNYSASGKIQFDTVSVDEDQLEAAAEAQTLDELIPF